MIALPTPLTLLGSIEDTARTDVPAVIRTLTVTNSRSTTGV